MITKDLFTEYNRDFPFTLKWKFHLWVILTTVSVNMLIWLSLNYRTDFFVHATWVELLLNVIQILIETVILTEATLYFSNFALSRIFRKEYSGKTLTIFFLTIGIFILAISALTGGFYKLIYPESETVFRETLFSDVLITAIVAELFLVNVHIIYFLKLDRSRKQAELDKLTLQTDPHFVFNSFNTLSELIYTDRDKAESYLEDLTELYRYIIRSKDRHLVPIREELHFLESYIRMITTCYDGSVNIDIDPDMKNIHGQIPPLALQSLVENAVKHNRHSESDRLWITIGLEGTDIVVVNNILPLISEVRSENTGLKNLDERYTFACGKHIKYYSESDRFIVKIPVLFNADR